MSAAARTLSSRMSASSSRLSALNSGVVVTSIGRGRASGTVMTGFYSYGEISPFTPSAKCELHNQTMTVTTFSEL